MTITAAQFVDVLGQIGDEMEAQKDRFSELDRAIGDGDHGVSMSMGWQAIAKALDELPGDADLGQICMTASRSFLGAVGGSCGPQEPLYGTALMRGAMALKGKTGLDGADVIAFLKAAGQGVQDRGKAEAGDKTMLDTWLPAIEALDSADGRPLPEALAACVAAAEKGMNATADMQSRKGRSSRLGERSVGHIDPGAASSFVFIKAFAEAVAKV